MSYAMALAPRTLSLWRIRFAPGRSAARYPKQGFMARATKLCLESIEDASSYSQSVGTPSEMMLSQGNCI